MPIVRVHPDACHDLIGAYDHVASELREQVAALSPLISRANQLLDAPPQNPLYGPLPALTTVSNDLGTDGRDLAWRLDWIQQFDGRPLGLTGRVAFDVAASADGEGPATLVEALLALGLTEEQAKRAAKEIEAGADFTDTVDAELARAEAEAAIAEFEAKLAELGVDAQGLFDVNPFTIGSDAELDERIEIVRRLALGQDPVSEIELEILLAIREQRDAAESEFNFVLSPADVVARRADGDVEDALQIAERWGDDLAGLNPAAEILHELNETQLTFASAQFEAALAAAPDFGTEAGVTATIALTREVLGMDETGQPQHTAESLGISEEAFGNGLQNSTIAEFLELQAWAADHSPAEYLTDEELAAIQLIEAHFAELLLIGSITVESPGPVVMTADAATVLSWEIIEQLARGEHLTIAVNDVPGTPADELISIQQILEWHYPEFADVSFEELQDIAQYVLANPRAFEALVGARDGTEIIQGEALTGNIGGGVNAQDIAGFHQQERLRQLVGHFSGDIDSITNGEIDGDISAQDFAQLIIEQPNLPVELQDLIYQAIDSGLTDTGGWERIQNAFETAGVVVGGATLLLLPGGNVAVLSGLAFTGVLIGAGEAYAAYQNGDDETLAFALAGFAFDAADATGGAQIGGAFGAFGVKFLGDLNLEDDVAAAVRAIDGSPELRDLHRTLRPAKPNKPWKPFAAAQYHLEVTAVFTRAGIDPQRADELAEQFLKEQKVLGHPTTDAAFTESQAVLQQYPNDANIIRKALANVQQPGLSLSELDADTIAAMRHHETRAAQITELAEKHGLTEDQVRHVLDGHASGSSGSGGHFADSPNIRTITTPTVNGEGVTEAQIEVYNPNTGRFNEKTSAPSSFFPDSWDEDQILEDIAEAFASAAADSKDARKWVGVSSSGVEITGFYDGLGGWSSAWPSQA